MTDDHRARDAYFTRPHVARQVWADAFRFCRRRGLDTRRIHWIEPSAGGGVFLDTAPRCVRHLTAYDIHPMHPDITKADFLYTHGWNFIGRPVALIGNPPFGTQQITTCRFIRHAIDELNALFCVFIASGNFPPRTRNRNRLAGICVADRIRIDGAGFQTPDGDTYDYGAQVAASVFARGENQTAIPPTQHADFYSYGYQTLSTRRSAGGKTVLECATAQLEARQWAGAIKTCSPQVLSMQEFEKFKFGGGGAFIIFAPRNGMCPNTLYKRMCSIDWKAVQDFVRDDGMVRGNISNWHVVEAYRKKFGGAVYRNRAMSPTVERRAQNNAAQARLF